MLVKKPRQHKLSKLKYSKFNWASGDTGVVAQELGSIDTGEYSASAHIGGGSSIDTISIDPSFYTAVGSITSPYTISTGTNNVTIGTGAGYNGTHYTYTTDGTSHSTWGTNSVTKITGNGLELDADADIKIGTKSLKKFLESVEERLAILQSRPDLEEKWDKLKDLKKQYDDMVKDIEEKQKIMDILKKD
jgi:hypothetical protein